MPNYAQLFCTVADVAADSLSGVDTARIYQAIREASDVLQKEIGWFIPVTATRKFRSAALFDLRVPPLLSITSISNDSDTLSSIDYILKPDDGHWMYGPYTAILPDPDSTLLYSWSGTLNGTVITGTWGLYNRSASISATVADTTQQSDSQTTLKVSNGAKVSPGMVLLIGSEQELVSGWETPSASTTQLNGALTATDDTLTVDDSSVLNVGEIIRIEFEQMQVRDIRTSTHQISVARGWNGTTRTTHADNTAVDVYRTVTVERGVNGTTAAVHANGVTISRYFAPDDIQYLCKQIATLIVNKAKSGYQGRTGNAETGVVFYNDAFPRYEMERIRQRYSLPRVP